MPTVLAELVAKITTDITGLKKGLGDADKGLQSFVQNNAKALKTAGVAMTAFGAAVVGTLTLAVKSFAGVGTELKELSQKTGISVESLSELKYAGKMTGVSLDTLAVAIRSMANFMDTATSETKESTATLKKLGLSLSDVRGLNPEQLFMKLSSAVAAVPDPMRRSALAVDVFGRSGTQLLPMLAEGQDGIAKLRQKAQELGITMSTETAEGADALGDALETVKSSMGGVFNAIGSSLAPIITDLAGRISNLISGIISWSKEHPELSKNILLVAGGLGILALALGPIIVFLPQIIGQIAALKVAFLTLSTAMGPVGWAIAGISAALIIALPWILSATSATKDLTGAMSDLEKQTFRMNVQQEFTAEKWADITEKGYLTEEEFRQLAKAMDITTQALYDQLQAAGMLEQAWTTAGDTRIFVKNLEELKIGLEKVADTSQQTTEEMISNLKTLSSEAKRRATETTQALISAVDERMRAENKAFSDRMANLDKEYSALIKNINARLGTILEGYQQQIDAINQLTESEDLARTRANEKIRLDELKATVKSAKTAEDLTKAKNDLAEYETEVKRNELLRSREDEKDAIRAAMDEARRKAQFDIDIAETTYNKEKSLLQQSYNDLVLKLENDKTVLDTALQEKLTRYDEDLAAFDETLALQFLSLEDFVKKYNEALAGLKDKTVVVTTIERTITGAGITPPGVTPPEIWPSAVGVKAFEPWMGLQKGGIISRPTLGLLGEQAPAIREAIIPETEWGEIGGRGNITIQFTQPVFFDREDTMNKFVDMIRKGIQRQDRLRFGGAYSG